MGVVDQPVEDAIGYCVVQRRWPVEINPEKPNAVPGSA